MDLVVNHTSWYMPSRRVNTRQSKGFLYLAHEPNGIISVFSGSAWEFDLASYQYYLHNFLVRSNQILNWENEELRQYDMMNFWLNKELVVSYGCDRYDR